MSHFLYNWFFSRSFFWYSFEWFALLKSTIFEISRTFPWTFLYDGKRPPTANCGDLPDPYRTTEGVSNHFMSRIGIFLLYEGSTSVQVSQLSRRKTKIYVMDWGMIYWSDFEGKCSAVASLRSQCFRADPSLWRRDNTQNINFTNWPRRITSRW